MAKRIRSRMELREQYDAAEAREREDRKDGVAEEAAAVEGDESAEGAPPKKKKKTTTTKVSKPRKKAVKQVRQRVVWAVYDNSNKKIAQYDYTKKHEAEEHAVRLQTEKKQTYFVQPLREAIQE